jgi:phospholipid N-methyltransferase
MEQARTTLFNRILFFYKFIQSPKTVGSITPSSFFLTKEMLKNINWSNTKTIVELGAGTGIFTNQIQQSKSPDSRVLIFELDPVMQNRLKELYPHFTFYSDATFLPKALQEQGLNQVDCIVSGLPFSNFSKGLREQIVDGVIKSLKPGGLFITFQYSLQMKKHLVNHFDEVDITLVPLNLPPAFVYCCKKKFLH